MQNKALKTQSTAANSVSLQPTTTDPISASLQPTTFEQLEKFVKYLTNSDFVPKDFKGKPGNALIAIQMGYEIGLKPMQAIQNISVINGRPCLWGDAMLAIVKAHPECEYVDESFDEENMIATCKVKRKNQPICERTFSFQEAKQAGLATRPTWVSYKKRMIQMRARAFSLRDSFPDALKGLSVAEEVQDYNVKEPIVENEERKCKQVDIQPTFINGKSISQEEFEEFKEEPIIEAVAPEPACPYINGDQVKELQTLMKEREFDIGSFYNYYEISDIEELKVDQFNKAVRVLLKRPLKNAKPKTKKEKTKKDEALETLNKLREEHGEKNNDNGQLDD